MSATTKLTAWLPQFQEELRNDIKNGAQVDCTRKPGFYYIRENIKIRYPDDEIPDANELFWHVTHRLSLLARTAFFADRQEHGLEMQCCEPWDFTTLEDAATAIAKNVDAIVEAICIADEDEFYEWASELPELERLFYETRREHRLDNVFLTRESGERHATRYGYRYDDPTVYAHHIDDQANPDLMNAITFLASLDLAKSSLVFTHEAPKKETQQ